MQVHVHLSVHVDVCTHVYTYTLIYVIRMYIHTYTYLHIPIGIPHHLVSDLHIPLDFCVYRCTPICVGRGVGFWLKDDIWLNDLELCLDVLLKFQQGHVRIAGVVVMQDGVLC